MSKSVSTTLEQKDYDALKKRAKEDDRNISGQMRHMLKRALFLAENEQKAHAINAKLYGVDYHHPGQDDPSQPVGPAPTLNAQDHFDITDDSAKEPLPG